MILISLIIFCKKFPFHIDFFHKVMFFFTMEKENMEKVAGKVIVLRVVKEKVTVPITAKEKEALIHLQHLLLITMDVMIAPQFRVGIIVKAKVAKAKVASLIKATRVVEDWVVKEKVASLIKAARVIEDLGKGATVTQKFIVTLHRKIIQLHITPLHHSLMSHTRQHLLFLLSVLITRLLLSPVRMERLQHAAGLIQLNVITDTVAEDMSRELARRHVTAVVVPIAYFSPSQRMMARVGIAIGSVVTICLSVEEIIATIVMEYLRHVLVISVLTLAAFVWLKETQSLHLSPIHLSEHLSIMHHLFRVHKQLLLLGIPLGAHL